MWDLLKEISTMELWSYRKPQEVPRLQPRLQAGDNAVLNRVLPGSAGQTLSYPTIIPASKG